jgi:hypothetical protein
MSKIKCAKCVNLKGGAGGRRGTLLQKFELSKNEIGEAMPMQLNLAPKMYIKTIICLNFISNGAIMN